MRKKPITAIGLKKLEDERSQLMSVERLSIIQAISEARALGDLSENAEYHAAKEQQSHIEGRIKELDSVIATSEVIDPSTIHFDTVVFGATVTIKDLSDNSIKTYQVVSKEEADLKNNTISYEAPIGKALMGKKVHDIAELKMNDKSRDFEILSIEYK